MIVKKALKPSLMFNESSNMKLSANNQKGVKMLPILEAILMLSLVVLVAVYFMEQEITVDPEGEETAVSIYQEVEEEQVLCGDLLGGRITEEDTTNRSNDSCRFELVESVPYDLAFEINSTAAKPLYRAWMSLLDIAQEKIHIASYYWSLTGRDINVNDSSSKQGEDILKRFERLLTENVSVYIAASVPTLATNSTDLHILAAKGAHVRKINFGHLTRGVMHSKFWIVDMKHIYIGSANMDWRSLSQVKEVGAVIYNCSCLAKDLWKTFCTYWDLGHVNATIPSPWPLNYSTNINKYHPLEVEVNGTLTKAYFSASPPKFCPKGRTHDLFSIISVISEAAKFVYVSVMEYFPTSRFIHPQRYWPAIDNALRRVAFDYKVPIRLLVSCWAHTDPAMLHYLRSLRALNNPRINISVNVKLFIVPVLNHTNIPYGRVNHNKFMVTDKAAYIGTSNWSEDYFINTAGVGLIIKQNSTNLQRRQLPIQEQLKKLFERDWNSKYSVNLEDVHGQKDCNWRGRL
ncbi:5'-3' exonuclease PLD4 isoform X1 [Dromaius novaehollandiae]|uniref:5'-3' exonuclease PLD4 isoform X1 n=3 Tax=Dromaius novaehollandiae TaxID=8790 RepID=UPI000E1FB3E3|nr:phospholipase D4 isoform X1 [Dromaius novaehollandiae]